MELANLPARFSAIHPLQSIRDRHRPGSYRYEQADLGIDLTLNPGRVAGPYLVRNVLRDAARTLRRNRESADLVSVAELLPHEEPAFAEPTPEEQAAFEQTQAALCRAVGPNRFAAGCLRALAAGRSVAETAAELGISPSYVKKLRAALRQAAATIWGRS